MPPARMCGRHNNSKKGGAQINLRAAFFAIILILTSNLGQIRERYVRIVRSSIIEIC